MPNLNHKLIIYCVVLLVNLINKIKSKLNPFWFRRKIDSTFAKITKLCCCCCCIELNSSNSVHLSFALFQRYGTVFCMYTNITIVRTLRHTDSNSKPGSIPLYICTFVVIAVCFSLCDSQIL